MACPAVDHRFRDGAKQRHGGQPVNKPAGQQHHEQQQLEQSDHQHVEHLQRQRARHAHSAAHRDCAVLHGRRYRLLPDWRVGLRVIERDRHWRRDLPARPAVRAAEVGQDAQRFWPQGGGRRDPVSGPASVPRYGHGRNAVSIPRGNWKTGHAVVATKP